MYRHFEAAALKRFERPGRDHCLPGLLGMGCADAVAPVPGVVIDVGAEPCCVLREAVVAPGGLSCSRVDGEGGGGAVGAEADFEEAVGADQAAGAFEHLVGAGEGVGDD